MDKKSEILLVVFAMIVLASVTATYFKYIVLGKVTYETDETAFQESLLEE